MTGMSRQTWWRDPRNMSKSSASQSRCVPPEQHFVDKIHPDDRPKFLATIARLTPENPTDEVTYRALASDGTIVWLKSNGRGFFDGEGKLLRVIGMVADVTDLKRAEEALAGMTRKLIEAQEQERARIGRELHDDINQRLAMLAVELDQLQENPSEIQRRVQELRKQLAEISDDVQALSHDLHSSKLEYLGCGCGYEKLVQRVRATARWRSTSKMMCEVFCHPNSGFPCSEFCRKRCTTRSSTVGSNASKCNWENTQMPFISSCVIQEMGSISKQLDLVEVWVSPVCANVFGW